MDDKFLIHVEIGDKTYPLRIRREEEEVVREAAKQLSLRISKYRRKFSDSELAVKDLLAMVALQLSLDNVKLQDKNDTAPYKDKIRQLTSELEVYLEENR